LPEVVRQPKRLGFRVRLPAAGRSSGDILNPSNDCAGQFLKIH